ncbi:1106_t:CDS:2, partial [Acaulospora morrowiae]
EASLHRSLNRLTNVASGGTRLYDSMVDIVETFHRSGDRTRPWVVVVVTDGDDNCSIRSIDRCAQEVSRLFTKESSNFLFVVGVGDNVDSTKMEKMATTGNFIYIPVKEFYLLEFAFLTLAYQVTTSLSLSLGSLSVGNLSASWAEVQRHRELSKVAIDYALLIDVSASMNSKISPPPPQCFAGHDMKSKSYGDWWCGVCGKDGKVSLLLLNILFVALADIPFTNSGYSRRPDIIAAPVTLMLALITVSPEVGVNPGVNVEAVIPFATFNHTNGDAMNVRNFVMEGAYDVSNVTMICVRIAW